MPSSSITVSLDVLKMQRTESTNAEMSLFLSMWNEMKKKIEDIKRDQQFLFESESRIQTLQATLAALEKEAVRLRKIIIESSTHSKKTEAPPSPNAESTRVEP